MFSGFSEFDDGHGTFYTFYIRRRSVEYFLSWPPGEDHSRNRFRALWKLAILEVPDEEAHSARVGTRRSMLTEYAH